MLDFFRSFPAVPAMPLFGDAQYQQQDGRYAHPPSNVFRKFRNWIDHRRYGGAEPAWGPEHTRAEGDHYGLPARRHTVDGVPVHFAPPGEPSRPRAYTYPQPVNQALATHQRAPQITSPMYPSYPSQGVYGSGHPYSLAPGAPQASNTPPVIPGMPCFGHGELNAYSYPTYNAYQAAPQGSQDRSTSTSPQRPQHNDGMQRRPSGSRAQPSISPWSSQVKGVVVMDPKFHASEVPYNAAHSLLTELIPSVSYFPSIDWNICFPVSTAFKWTRPDKRVPLVLETLAVVPPVHVMQILPRKNNDALSFVLTRFGEIRVSAARHLNLGDLLEAIKIYFERPLKDEELESLKPKLRKQVMESFQRRWEAQGTENSDGLVWPKLSHANPTRADLLFESFQYAGMEMDQNFVKNRKLYLKLENRQSSRTR